jgi:hypothetical protein
MFTREQALMDRFKSDTEKIIKDTCDMYSISVAMVLLDGGYLEADAMKKALTAIEKHAEELNEDRLAIGDCRRVLKEEYGIIIGDDETYARLELTSGDNEG